MNRRVNGAGIALLMLVCLVIMAPPASARSEVDGRRDLGSQQHRSKGQLGLMGVDRQANGTVPVVVGNRYILEWTGSSPRAPRLLLARPAGPRRDAVPTDVGPRLGRRADGTWVASLTVTPAMAGDRYWNVGIRLPGRGRSVVLTLDTGRRKAAPPALEDGPAENTAPLAMADRAFTLQDTPVSIPVAALLVNDSDADGDPLTVSAVASDRHGTATLVAGTVTFTPATGFAGTAALEYAVVDGRGGEGRAEVLVAVQSAPVETPAIGGAPSSPPNDPPVAEPDVLVTAEDVTVEVSAPGVLANDMDAEADALYAVPVSGPSHGTLMLSASGALSYTPEANWNGTDSFTYTANDGTASSNVVTATITVTPVDDPLLVQSDAYLTDEDTTLIVAAPGVLANDSDADGPLGASVATGPIHGSVTLNPDGSFAYSPDGNFHGVDSFTYAASIDGSDSAPTAVTVTIAPVNDPPVAVADAYVTSEDTTLTADSVLANDLDADSDALGAVLVSGPSHGSLTLNANGTLAYVPDPNWNGTDSFTYTANDATASSNVATATITVTPVDDSILVANDDYFTTSEDTPIAFPAPFGLLTANDTDPDGDTLTVYVVSNVVNGTLAYANGALVFTPTAEFSGQASFTYGVNDGNGSVAAGTVHITVEEVDDPTVAFADSFTVSEDASLTPTAPGVLANDIDPDDAIVAVLVSGASHGYLSLNPDGSFTYVPSPNWHGIDTFAYQASSVDGSSGPVTVTIVVQPVNDLPVAVDDAFTIVQGSSWSMPMPLAGLLANDTDVDGDSLTVVTAASVMNGTLSISGGLLVFTPDAAFTGQGSFMYTVHDGNGGVATATVRIAVTEP